MILDFYEYWNFVKTKYLFLEYQQLMELLSSKSACDIEMVVQSFQCLVCSIVNKYLGNAKRYGVLPMELVSAGNLGLQKAIETFNCGKGQDFFSTAEGYIKSYIECEYYSHTVHSRREGKKLVAQYKEERESNALLGKETPPLNLYPVTYLSQVIDEDEEGNPLKFEDVLPDGEAFHWLEQLEIDDLLKILEKANGEIHPKAEEIVELRFGIGRRRSYEPLSLKETAIVVHLSREWVRKIEGKAIEYLKSEMFILA